jgi:transposase
VLIIGEANRFGCGKQISSYLGLVPAEDSSAERRRLGHIRKQGNSLLRFLLVEAAQATVRSDCRWRNQFFHLAKRRGRTIAK